MDADKGRLVGMDLAPRQLAIHDLRVHMGVVIEVVADTYHTNGAHCSLRIVDPRQGRADLYPANLTFLRALCRSLAAATGGQVIYDDKPRPTRRG